MALVRIVRSAVLEASYQLPGIVWDWKSVRAGDGMRWVSEDVVDDHLHDSSETDDDERSEELTDISGNCTQLQCEILQELEEKGKREGMEGEAERREGKRRGRRRGRERWGRRKRKGRGMRNICCYMQISRLCFVELTRALNWRHSATRSAKSPSPSPFPFITPRSTLAMILLRFAGRSPGQSMASDRSLRRSRFVVISKMLMLLKYPV